MTPAAGTPGPGMPGQGMPGQGPPCPGTPEPAGLPGTAIRIEGLRKAFGSNEVLTGIDLTVGTHEVICLIGASGSGKSTLLRCLNLLEPIDAGRISLWDQDITAAGVDDNLVRRSIGIVFQSYNLFPHMNVLQNVTLAPRKARGTPRARAEEEARALLSRFGLDDKER